MPDEPVALDFALNLATDGDLLVINGDDTVRCWKQIIYFKNPNRSEQAATSTKPRPVVVGMEDLITDADTLIRDERGVRLARNSGEGGD